MTKVIEKTTAATIVYRKLRQDILMGALEPGQKLAIDLVAERYGVGTNPVREALNRLSAERLVDRHEQRGFFVPAISIENWRELVKTRCWLETKALEESMRNRSTAWEENIVLAFYRLSRVQAAKQELSAADRSEWEVPHRAFHIALIANCQSTWMLEFCEVLMDHAQRYIFVSDSYAYPRRNGLEEHRELMDVVLGGDIPVASEMLVEHYHRTLNKIEAQLGG
ncbi:GntR family transcriptional regulator [Microvirga brassicacearum]|uniref:GntR family transcriptional regulator n=1 Tax=Microvirga brassicacearum TaxID=2580413 RepID=A0A5N3P3Z2_9HYPH|nr:GntR family transcriptional regulator [Microvirga brassicacearum]KAB0264450.1 GntR family transcriptional regulator [Microvirga brassicacearum]